MSDDSFQALPPLPETAEPPERELRDKAAKWDEIEKAWRVYLTYGAAVFDWDCDSRAVMDRLAETSGL